MPLLESSGERYKKYKEVYARIATVGERIVSVTSAGVETENIASEGDYLVQNQTTAGEKYLVSGGKFEQRYEKVEDLEDGFARYSPNGQVVAIQLTDEIMAQIGLEGSFEIEAPWGSAQNVHPGDFVVTPPDFSEIYAIGKKEFAETYVEVD